MAQLTLKVQSFLNGFMPDGGVFSQSISELFSPFHIKQKDYESVERTGNPALNNIAVI